MTASPPETPKRRRGPGRPFAPGRSGNPEGARTGSRNRASLALDALAAGEANAILAAMVAKAIEGDVAAASLILNRTWPARKGRPTPLPLPPVRNAADTTAALGVIVAEMAAGNVSAEEAQAAASVLETHRRSIETSELETRIAALEAAKGGTA